MSVTQDGTVSCNNDDSFSPAASRTSNRHTVLPPISLRVLQKQQKANEQTERMKSSIVCRNFLPKNHWCMFRHWKVSVSGDTFFAWCMRQLPVFEQCLQQKTSIINLIAENRPIHEIIRTILESSSRCSRLKKAHILLNRIQPRHVQAIPVQLTPMHRSNQHPRLYPGQ